MASLFDDAGITPERVETFVNDYKQTYRDLRKLIDSFKTNLPLRVSAVNNIPSQYSEELAELANYPEFLAQYELYRPHVEALLLGVSELIAEQEAAAQ